MHGHFVVSESLGSLGMTSRVSQHRDQRLLGRAGAGRPFLKSLF